VRDVGVAGTMAGVFVGVISSVLGASGFALYQHATAEPQLSTTAATYAFGETWTDVTFVVTNSGDAPAERCVPYRDGYSDSGHMEDIPARASVSFSWTNQWSKEDHLKASAKPIYFHVKCKNGVESNLIVALPYKGYYLRARRTLVGVWVRPRAYLTDHGALSGRARSQIMMVATRDGCQVTLFQLVVGGGHRPELFEPVGRVPSSPAHQNAAAWR
jgi:hypothetical protein